MEDFNSELKECGFDLMTRLILCFYFKPETIRAVIDATMGGDNNVDPLQSESTWQTG